MTAVRDIEQVTGEKPAGGSRRIWRWLLPVLAIVAWLVVGGGLGPLSAKTSEVQKNNNSSYLPQSAESTEVQELLTGFTKTQSSAAIVIYTRDGGLTDDDKAKILGDKGDFGRHLGGQLVGAPVGPFYSKDGKAAELILQFTATDPNLIGVGVR